jgi:perosamine synthetase
MAKQRDVTSVAVSQSATLQDVLLAIDVTALGIACVVDEAGILQGVMTDGDVRRAILRGASQGDSCVDFMNTNFTSGRVDASRNDNLRLMSERVTFLPLLDGEGRLVSYISWRDMWSVPLVAPALSGNELKYVSECITSGWVSSQGSFVGRFEVAMQQYVGSRFALSTANGTLALQLAIQGLGIGPGDEVIVPDFTFGASANAVMQCGASPVFADIDPNTWTLDPTAVESLISDRTRAIMPVHIYGHPCDMDPLIEIARQHRLRVIEDCAEAVGAAYKGQPVGSIGDVGCFSFFANKIITTGEGGMVTTSDADLHERMMTLRDHGARPDRRYWHVEPGTNARMTNMQAALGVAQMERIDEFLAARDALAERYADELRDAPGIMPHLAASWARKVCWLFTVRVDPHLFGKDRDTLIHQLHEKGIETRPVFSPLHEQPAFVSGRAGACRQSQRLAKQGMSLPTSNDMPVIETLRVVQSIRELARHAA